MIEEETLRDLATIFLVSILAVILFKGCYYLAEDWKMYLEQHPEIIENVSAIITPLQEIQLQGIVNNSFLWYVILAIGSVAIALIFYFAGLSVCIGTHHILIPVGMIIIIISNFLLGISGSIILGIIACVSLIVGVCRSIDEHTDAQRVI